MRGSTGHATCVDYWRSKSAARLCNRDLLNR